MARVGDFVASLQERPLPGRCQIAACKAFEGVAIFDGVCNLVGLFAGGGGVCAQAKTPVNTPSARAAMAVAVSGDGCGQRVRKSGVAK